MTLNTTTLKQQVLERKQRLQPKCFKTNRHLPDIYMFQVITSTLGRCFETVETNTDERCGREANNTCKMCALGYHPLKNTTPLFYLSPLLNLQTTQAPLFRQSLPVYWFFHKPLLKIGFLVNPHNIKISYR